jgi:RNA polymerase sigma factor (sigma-70 family)
MTDAIAAAWPHQTPGQYLEAAYQEHAATCRLYALQIVGAGRAEDAAQEAFIRLLSHLVREKAVPHAPRAWLLAATRSAALDLLRSDKRRLHRESHRPEMAFAEGPADRLEAREVTESLEGLPQRQREAIVLRIWGDLGFAEIAELLGVALSTAHGDYQAGLSALREKLDPPRLRQAEPKAPAIGAQP